MVAVVAGESLSAKLGSRCPVLQLPGLVSTLELLMIIL